MGIEKVQFTKISHFVMPHFDTIFNAARKKKMLRKAFSKNI